MKIRKFKDGHGKPRYQLGTYEMYGPKGKRRSRFVVAADLGYFDDPHERLDYLRREESRLGYAGKFKSAVLAARKRDRLWRALYHAGMLARPRPKRTTATDLLVAAYEEMMDAGL